MGTLTDPVSQSAETSFAIDSTSNAKAPTATGRALVVIQAGKLGDVLNLREVWRYRELLYFLAWRDVKVRYKQTFFGVGWVLLQPLLMTTVFTVFLGVLARVPSSLPYPLLVLSGLLPWAFVSSSVIGCGQSLTGNASLITKVYFPRILVPIAHVLGRVVDFAILLVIVVFLILYYRLVLDYPVPLTWAVVALPVVFAVTVLFTLALGILAACLNVRYRDVGMGLPVLVQIWMFVSPVVYSPELVPGKWRLIYYLNPMVGLVQGFRAGLLGESMPLFAGLSTIIFTSLTLFVALVVFRRTEKSMADFV